MRSNIAFDVVYTHTEGEPTLHHTFRHLSIRRARAFCKSVSFLEENLRLGADRADARAARAQGHVRRVPHAGFGARLRRRT